MRQKFFTAKSLKGPSLWKINISNPYFSIDSVNNFRLKLDRASVALEELATKGPLKPEALRGL